MKENKNGKAVYYITLVLSYATFLQQLALRWQIAKKLSGLNPFLLSNNKNYRLKKNGVFPLSYKVPLHFQVV